MTYDDGIVSVYRDRNTAANGAMPVMLPVLLFSEYFGFDALGTTRYFTALQANVRIESVINIPDWPDAVAGDHAVLQDGCPAHDSDKLRIVMVQKLTGKDGLKYTKLSLERMAGGKTGGPDNEIN